jgi:hypothetical protein
MGCAKPIDLRTKWLLALSLRPEILEREAQQMQKSTVPTAMYEVERYTGDACYPGLVSGAEHAVDLFTGLPDEVEAGAETRAQITLEASHDRIAALRADISARDGWRIKL